MDGPLRQDSDAGDPGTAWAGRADLHAPAVPGGLSGGVSQSDDLLKDLSERLEIPVDRVDPFKEIKIDYAKFDKSYIESLAPYMSVAVGLAVRRLAD